MHKIRINNIKLFGYHGLLESEKHTGQVFEIDIEVITDFSKSFLNDDLRFTINYAETFDIVRNVFNNQRYNLIESLANEISESILNQNGVESVKVIVRKPDAPINGEFDNVEVEIIKNAK
jgi:7,8-dihydroneopterin aldolase/epimerase/oxygenase